MNKENNKSGNILIDKPAGITSFSVIAKLRKITGIKKIGHAGTLDPFATGLLIVAIGREATREIDKFVKQNKVYEAELKLGEVSSTMDPEGEIKKVNDNIPSEDEVETIVKTFKGKQEQIPPMHSAIKINGQKLYNLARKGIEIERKPREIEIFDIEILDYNYPSLKIRTHVSSGTYIRSLVNDIGEKLETGAYCQNLRRTRIGDFDIKDAVNLDDLSGDSWLQFVIPG
ncbi:tRNA pseudouridine(55) synthase TruB [Candidatus Parcubacteria bacterium]|nr:MAG: tRNA pseudouridine(55) synthase TruB [Candidatus Parcubacteria bacterium]